MFCTKILKIKKNEKTNFDKIYKKYIKKDL